MARFPLTPDRERQLLAAIRAGTYPQVAAAAVGIPRARFLAWMRLGRKRVRGRCRHLWLEVCTARAFARMRAEIEARQKDVRFWLRYGPGTDDTDAPGWAPTRRRPSEASERIPDWQPLIDGLLTALVPYPEAREAVLRALEARPSPPSPD